MRPGRLRWASGRRRLLGWGAAYPGPALDTAALCAKVSAGFDLPPSLLRQGQLLERRLGVAQRHICRDFLRLGEGPRPGARNPELAAEALRVAMARAGGGQALRLSYLISHTATPALWVPGGSAEIAARLGHDGAHLELRQACTGFANALQMAFALTAAPAAEPVALVGVETGSVFFDPNQLHQDPSQWINFLQMGDGAAGIVLGPDDGGPGPWLEAAYFGQMQSAPPAGLSLRVGASDQPACQAEVSSFEHDYKAVAEHGQLLLEWGREALASQGFSVHQAERVVPHQASGVVAPWLAARWGLRPERVCNHAVQVGNLGSASLWAALVHTLDVDLAGHWPQAPLLFLGAEATQYSIGGFALVA